MFPTWNVKLLSTTYPMAQWPSGQGARVPCQKSPIQIHIQSCNFWSTFSPPGCDRYLYSWESKAVRHGARYITQLWVMAMKTGMPWLVLASWAVVMHQLHISTTSHTPLSVPAMTDCGMCKTCSTLQATTHHRVWVLSVWRRSSVGQCTCTNKLTFVLTCWRVQ